MIELQVYENGVSSFCPINEQSCEFWKKNKPVTLWISLSNRKQQIPCKRKLIKKGKTTPILKKEVICKEEQRDA